MTDTNEIRLEEIQDENNLSPVLEGNDDTGAAADLDAAMESAIAEAQGERPRPVLPRYTAKEYFDSGEWDDQQRAFQANKPIMTGYPWMDAEQPLYPGLYVLGAISSLGKTTFLHQMGDQIAADGTPVLYFSFEQTAHELYAKSLSRRIRNEKYSNPSYHPYTAIEIRQGFADGTQELTEHTDAYKKAVEDRMQIIECNLYTTVEDILDVIEEFMSNSSVKPVVIVDYLQIIYPTDVNGRVDTDQRFNIDHIVKALKQYQKDRGIVLIAICSLNRANYMSPVDMESFKESGCIEYTADVVWGLNLALIFDKDFETKTVGKSMKDTTKTDKQLMVMKAKEAPIRDIVLKAVKNRYGKASYTVYFEYEAAYDNFTKGSQISYLVHKNQLQEEVDEEQRRVNAAMSSEKKD